MSDAPAVCPSCGEAPPPGSGYCPKDGTPIPGSLARVGTKLLPQDPAPKKDPLIGQRLGEYEVVDLLGEGGMGVVFRGVQPLIGKQVAIKVLRWEIARDPEQMARLLGEARTVNAVRHRGIIDIFSFGQTPDGRQYFVMELLDGIPLDRIITETAPMPVVEALSLLEEVLDALAAAHGAGVIHRDLKPSNIFVVKPSRGARYVKLLDFGLAKQAPIPGGTTPQTRASMLVGTPHYMAPEQARGQEVGPATDLYALGVLAFEMLTRSLPFEASTPFEVIAKHLNEPAPRPSSLIPEIPPRLDDLVAHLLRKDPLERPPNAEGVRELLAEIRAEEAAKGPAQPSVRAPRSSAAAPRPSTPGADATSISARTHISSRTPNAPAAASAPPPATSAAAVDAVAQARLEALAPKKRPGVVVVALVAVVALAGAGAFLALRRGADPAVEAMTPTPVEVRAAPEVKLPTPPPPPVQPVVERPARLSLTSNAPCDAFLDGKPIGKTPIAAHELAAGAHKVVCKNAFGSEAEVQVQATSGSDLSETITFRTGKLETWVVPYAEVKVDGKPRGETPIPAIELVEGTHRVELTMEAKVVTRAVVVKPGETVKLRVNMEAP